jgi:hypothetical protein
MTEIKRWFWICSNNENEVKPSFYYHDSINKLMCMHNTQMIIRAPNQILLNSDDGDSWVLEKAWLMLYYSKQNTYSMYFFLLDRKSN